MRRTGYRLIVTEGLEGFAADVVAGLSADAKAISSKYFYDDEGSRLFQRIMELDEYYLTRCEEEILRTQGAAIASRFPTGRFQLVELGAGDGVKTAILIEALLASGREVVYRPIDISEGAMKALEARMAERFPSLEMAGLVGDYTDGLSRAVREGLPTAVLFLGSNLGNFSPRLANEFLQGVRRVLSPGDLFYLGLDLQKDPAVLHAAYDDAAGVTAAFNKNLLTRINRELGGDFDVDSFRHCASYNFHNGAMESFLVSMKAQTVTLSEVGRSFRFDRWEPIHTECSYKYTPRSIVAMARGNGFRVVESFHDAREYFCDSLWEALA